MTCQLSLWNPNRFLLKVITFYYSFHHIINYKLFLLDGIENIIFPSSTCLRSLDCSTSIYAQLRKESSFLHLDTLSLNSSEFSTFSHSLLPLQLKHLQLKSLVSCDSSSLPLGLKSLRIFCASLSPTFPLPPLLTHLSILASSINSDSLNSFPATLTHLLLDSLDFNHPLTNLPPSLHYLKLNTPNFHSELVLPDSLLHLSISSQSFSLRLPASLITLKIKNNSTPLLTVLPPTLITLKITTESYYHPLPPLPTSLKELILPKKYWKRAKKSNDSFLVPCVDSPSFAIPYNGSLPPNVLRMQYCQ